MTVHLSQASSFNVPWFVEKPLRWLGALLVTILLPYLFLFTLRIPYLNLELTPLFLWFLGPALGYAYAGLIIPMIPLGKLRRRGILFLCLLGCVLFAGVNQDPESGFYSAMMLFLTLGTGVFLKFTRSFPDTNYTK